MNRKDFAFGKENFVLLGIAIVVIVIGYLLMTGSATTEETGFNPDIFSKRRIVFAPLVCMIGYILAIVAIVFKSKDKEEKKWKD